MMRILNSFLSCRFSFSVQIKSDDFFIISHSHTHTHTLTHIFRPRYMMIFCRSYNLLLHNCYMHGICMKTRKKKRK